MLKIKSAAKIKTEIYFWFVCVFMLDFSWRKFFLWTYIPEAVLFVESTTVDLLKRQRWETVFWLTPNSVLSLNSHFASIILPLLPNVGRRVICFWNIMSLLRIADCRWLCWSPLLNGTPPSLPLPLCDTFIKIEKFRRQKKRIENIINRP